MFLNLTISYMHKRHLRSSLLEKIRKRANLIFPTSAVADPNSGAVELAGEDVTGHVLHCACVTAPALCQARRGANTGGRLRCNRCNRCR